MYQDILNLIEYEFGEIGNVKIEDDHVSFEVYRDNYENAPNSISGRKMYLELVNKFDDPFFTLVYKVERR